jgi:hypothetical protein
MTRMMGRDFLASVFAFVIVVPICGCQLFYYEHDVSNIEPYSRYVGRTVVAPCDCELRKDKEQFYVGREGSGPPLSFENIHFCTKLPAGTPFILEGIHNRPYFITKVVTSAGYMPVAIISLQNPKDPSRRIRAEVEPEFLGLDFGPRAPGAEKLEAHP